MARRRKITVIKNRKVDLTQLYYEYGLKRVKDSETLTTASKWNRLRDTDI